MTKKQIDRMIGQLYSEYCSGMQISVMRIPDLFKLARGWIEKGATRQEVGARMIQFVSQEQL